MLALLRTADVERRRICAITVTARPWCASSRSRFTSAELHDAAAEGRNIESRINYTPRIVKAATRAAVDTGEQVIGAPMPFTCDCLWTKFSLTPSRRRLSSFLTRAILFVELQQLGYGSQVVACLQIAQFAAADLACNGLR